MNVRLQNRLKVLLVEDSPKLVERLTEMLSHIPEVILMGTAATETEAVTLARREVVDVVILDLHLRQGTGFGVLRTLAAIPLNPQILVFTNFDLPEYKSTAMDWGATYFLDKARDYVRLPELLQAMAHVPPSIH